MAVEGQNGRTSDPFQSAGPTLIFSLSSPFEKGRCSPSVCPKPFFRIRSSLWDGQTVGEYLRHTCNQMAFVSDWSVANFRKFSILPPPTSCFWHPWKNSRLHWHNIIRVVVAREGSQRNGKREWIVVVKPVSFPDLWGHSNMQLPPWIGLQLVIKRFISCLPFLTVYHLGFHRQIPSTLWSPLALHVIRAVVAYPPVHSFIGGGAATLVTHL